MLSNSYFMLFSSSKDDCVLLFSYSANLIQRLSCSRLRLTPLSTQRPVLPTLWMYLSRSLSLVLQSSGMLKFITRVMVRMSTPRAMMSVDKTISYSLFLILVISPLFQDSSKSPWKSAQEKSSFQRRRAACVSLRVSFLMKKTKICPQNSFSFLYSLRMSIRYFKRLQLSGRIFENCRTHTKFMLPELLAPSRVMNFMLSFSLLLIYSITSFFYYPRVALTRIILAWLLVRTKLISYNVSYLLNFISQSNSSNNSQRKFFKESCLFPRSLLAFFRMAISKCPLVLPFSFQWLIIEKSFFSFSRWLLIFRRMIAVCQMRAIVGTHIKA